MKIKADLHNHLAHDNLKCFEQEGFFNRVIDKAAKELGSGGILGLGNCLSTRYEKFIGLKGYDRVDLENAIYVPEKDILVVKAQEVFAKQGDILALGLPKDVYIGEKGKVETLSLEESIAQANGHGAIIGIDHGYFIQGALPYIEKKLKILEDVDAIEVHNGNAWIPVPPFANKKAQEFYNEVVKDFPHLGTWCSSDGHSVFEVGSSYSLINPVDVSDGERMKKSLRQSITEHKDWSEDKRTNSYIGAGIHAALMALFQEKPSQKP